MAFLHWRKRSIRLGPATGVSLSRQPRIVDTGSDVSIAVTLRQRIRTDIAPSRACAILICLGAHANLSACRRRCLFQQVLPGLRRGSTRSLCHPIAPDPISSQFARKPYACAKENPPNQPNPPLTIRNSLAALGGDVLGCRATLLDHLHPI